jgi:hypothetical protein
MKRVPVQARIPESGVWFPRRLAPELAESAEGRPHKPQDMVATRDEERHEGLEVGQLAMC